MKYSGINPIKVEGSSFDAVGYGYSKVVNLKIKNNRSNPILVAKINPFGVKEFKDRIKANIFGRVEEKQNLLSFYAKTSNPATDGWLLGISTIILGEDVWGPKSGFELGQVKNYKKIKTSTKWDFKVKEGFADFVYDIWLNKNKEGGCSKEDVEIMVWLDYNFEVPWKEIGNFKDFRVKYEKKTKDKHPHDLGNTFAFIPKNKNGKINFDYKEMIDFCSKYLKRDLKNNWIRSIYLGTEFSKNTEVKVDLLKANLFFE